jgi:small subunit ribosomal protein S1
VINIQEYGIFVELEDGLEVFIHRNDFSWEKEEQIIEYKLGDIVRL